MDTKFLRILEHLEPSGVGEVVNISPVLLQFYPHVNKMIRHEVNPAWNTIYRLLEDMRLAELITPLPYPSIGSGNEVNGYTWIDDQPVNVHLRPKGLEALEREKNKGTEKRLQESMIETNESILATNALQQTNIRSQERLTKTALWIAGTSAFIAVLTFIIAILPKSDKPSQVSLPQTDSILKSTEKKIESLTQRLQSLDSTLKERNKGASGQK